MNGYEPITNDDLSKVSFHTEKIAERVILGERAAIIDHSREFQNHHTADRMKELETKASEGNLTEAEISELFELSLQI